MSVEPHLGLVDEAEWQLGVSIDEDGDLGVTIDAASFGGWVTTFVAPGQPDEAGIERDHWWVVQEQEGPNGEIEIRHEGPVSAPDVIDKVPHAFEQWVLNATRAHVDYLDGEGDGQATRDEIAAANALRAELDQAQAHAGTWQDRFRRRYGDIYIYELPAAAPLSWERGRAGGSEALLVWETASDDRARARAYIVPDRDHPWRWTEAGDPERAGEFLPTHEVLARVPGEFHPWVRHATEAALALTRQALATAAEHAREADDPELFAELARLALHARNLAAGRDAEPFAPAH